MNVKAPSPHPAGPHPAMFNISQTAPYKRCRVAQVCFPGALACRRKQGAAEGSSHRSFGFPSIYFAEVLWQARKFLKLINAKVSYTVVPHTQEKKKKKACQSKII